MALHAVDDLSDAVTATREFLFPFTWGRWLRLALISLFVAGGSGGGSPPNMFQYTMGGPGPAGTGYHPGFSDIGTVLQQHLGVLVLIGGLVFLLTLVLGWLASTLEFALLESLRQDSVTIRRYIRQFSGLGTRLFAFRLVFGLGVFLVIGAIALAIIWPVLMGVGRNFLFLLVFLAPVFLIIGLMAAIIYVLTTAFVVPIMLLEDRGVLSAWRRFWPTLTGDWKQILVFLLVGMFVMMVIGIAVGIVAAIAGILLAIPFGLFFYLFVVGGAGGIIGPIVLLLLAVPLALVFFVLMAFVQVPVQVYLRYWALLVLGDVNATFDLIPAQRTQIRSGGEA
jgi:hypothetical protein